jgi:hypothetical protein
LASEKEFKDKYLYYIGYLRKMDEIEKLSELVQTTEIKDRLAELRDVKKKESMKLQSNYWTKATEDYIEKGVKMGKRKKGIVWNNDPSIGIEYIRSVLDNIFEDFSNLLLSKGLQPKEIIKKLNFEQGVIGSLAGADLKSFDGTNVLKLLKTIQKRAIAIAIKTHNGSKPTAPAGGGGGAAGGGSRKQVGGSHSIEFYKTMLILILLVVHFNHE